MMDEETTKEIRDLLYNLINQGRHFAREYRAFQVPETGTTKHLIKDLLDHLENRTGIMEFDEGRLQLFENIIRKFVNSHREGLGDRAVIEDVETDHIFDLDVLDMINMSCRWRKFASGKRALDDRIAAIQEADRILQGI